MTLYCDSTAIVSVYLRERGRHQVVQPLVEREPAACSVLGYVEVMSALVRARFRENPRRLTSTGYERAVNRFEADWVNYVRAPITDDLLQAAATLTRRYFLRAYDAIHLASALALKELVVDSVIVSTWDRDLATATLAEGLSLAHEVTT